MALVSCKVWSPVFLALCCVWNAVAQDNIFNFNYRNGGKQPRAGLIVGPDGVLYGTTSTAGADGFCTNGCGTVFLLTPQVRVGPYWKESALHIFTGRGGDGAIPVASLAMDASGVLYGTTMAGGDLKSPGCAPSGCGAVFSVAPPKAADRNWTYKVMYTFGRDQMDGRVPVAGLVVGEDGTLYGTTSQGGTSAMCSGGCGAVFSLSRPASAGGRWRERVLYSFTGTSGDGAFPPGTLVRDSSGRLYGTTSAGGTLAPGICNAGCGTVFALAPPPHGRGSWSETILHRFTGNGGDGAVPTAGLVAGAEGVMYGTTSLGGLGSGTVFQVTSGGVETAIHIFGSHGGTQSSPHAPLAIDGAGNLYGALVSTSAAQQAVFELISPAQPGGAWTEHVLRHFGYAEFPNAVAVGGDGEIYGTTEFGPGPASGNGTIYKIP